MSGPLLFARFAYPPNALGYCGPNRASDLLEYANAGLDDGGIRPLAQRFEAAWPYLELIANTSRISDPLDPRVVEAYWIGNPLVQQVDVASLGRSLESRFRPVTGRRWTRLEEVLEATPQPHHNFHVFCVYPYVGLLRTGAVDDALRVLDRCRIRWARVTNVDPAAGTAVVDSSPLTWDGRRLALGALRPETVRLTEGGRTLAGPVSPGDLVACHWNWACHHLSPQQARRLRATTRNQLELVNHLPIPPPATALA